MRPAANRILVLMELTMRSAVWLVTLISALVLCGCAAHRPLLVSDQAKLIDQQTRNLKPLAKSVQDQIKASGTTAALVVLAGDSNSVPLIYPTSDPSTTALEHLKDLQSGSSCLVVFSRGLPLEPEEFSCAFLAQQVMRLRDDQEWKRDYEVHFNEVRDALVELKSQVIQVSEQLKLEQANLDQDRKLIERTKSDIEGLGNVVGPMSGLVQWHEAQLRRAGKLLDQLNAQYGKTAEVIGKNNDQIDSLIKDLNSTFAQVQKSISDMQQKLAMIH
jgi:gas vesicle protein